MNLVKINKWKIFLVGICSLSIYFIINISGLKCEGNIISQFHDGGEYHYVIKDGDNYLIKSYEKEVKSTDGKLHYEETHPIVAISHVTLFVLLICLFVATIIGDTETGWEISECWTKAKLSIVKCDVEDDVYYYHYNGKLLCKSEYQLKSNSIESLLDQPFNLLPDFPGTKSQRRDKKLKELFNEN